MTNELVQTGFFNLEQDTHQKTWHIGLEEQLRDTLRQRAAKIKAVVAQANFIIGEELATAQKELTYKNGGFVKWLEEEVGIDFQRAYEFIQIWENYKMFPLSGNIYEIGKKVLLAGARKDVPESARKEIVARNAAGEKVTLATTDEIIARHKAELEELQEEKQELQTSFDLFKADREKERQEYNNKLKGIENEKAAKEDEILGYKQAKVILDGQMRSKTEEIARLKAALEKQPDLENREQLEKELEEMINARLREETRQKLLEQEEQLKASYAQKEHDLQFKAENTIHSLLSHGIKRMAEAQLTIENTVSDGMLTAVQQLGGKQVRSFLAQAESLQEELDRVIAKLTHGQYLELTESIGVNG